MWQHIWVGSDVILTCGKWSYHVGELFYGFTYSPRRERIQRRSDTTRLPVQCQEEHEGSYERPRENSSRDERLKTRKTEPDDSLSLRLCHYSTSQKPRKLPSDIS
jgi:hypothetical protein